MAMDCWKQPELCGSADGLATARIQEALQLRHAGINQRLLLLGTLLSADEVSLCAEHSIDIVVHNASSLERVCKHKGKKLNVWIKLDTGHASSWA